MRVVTYLIPALLLGPLVLAPLVASQAVDSVHLSANHAAAVDRQRRIFFQYDPAGDIQRKGWFGADMDAVMSYVFDVLILGARTIKVDVDSFRKSMAGAHVKLMPSFDCFRATDGYHGDQSLDLVCGVFGNYLHQGADGVGAFNGIIGFPEQAEKLGLTQTDTRDLQVFSTIGSLATMNCKARYYPVERRGGYAHNEGYGSSNNQAPLPIMLRNDQTPAVLTLAIWEPVKSGVTARLRLVLFQHLESDDVTVQINGAALKQDLADAQWKDPRIFSPDSQPATVTPGALVKNPATQKLTRLEFLVPTEIMKRGENQIAIAVNRKGPFPPSTFVKVEKVEMHLK